MPRLLYIKRFKIARSSSSNIVSSSLHVEPLPLKKRVGCIQAISPAREVRATLALTLFILSQLVLPQAVLLQGAGTSRYGIKSAEAAESKSTKATSSRALSQSGRTKESNARSAEPDWYRVSHLKDVRRQARMQNHARLLLAQNLDKRGNSSSSSVTVAPLGGAATGTATTSGSPSVSGVFPVALRPSVPLAKPPVTSHFDLDLSKNRVPTQAEIVAEGSLAGPLSPVAPAEAEQYAAHIDEELRVAGFEDGLNTEFPTPEQALARRLPGLIAAAQSFDEAKKKVKKARDENREFAQSIQKWNHNQFKQAADELEGYVKKYPLSPWTPEAMIHVANYAKYTGRGDDAEDLYRQVIEMTSDDPNEMSYNAHRKAFGRLTDLYLIEGRYGEVRPMLENLLYKDTSWSRRTWGLYWLTQINSITSNPQTLLAARDCGTQALAALLTQTDHPHEARQVRLLKPSSARGFSLEDLREIAGQRNVSLVGFSATPAQLSKLPLPLLLHFGSKAASTKGANLTSFPDELSSPGSVLPHPGSLEHFVLVRSYDARRDAWNVLNPQDGSSATLTSAQLARQWSGRGLMLAHQPLKQPKKSPIPSFASGRIINASFIPSQFEGNSALRPVERLSVQQMRSTFGAGYAVKGQTNIGDDKSNVQICGSCPAKGSPAVSINPISQNMFITDTPLWYSPAKGPDVEITISYNSLDASNHDRKVGGIKWSFNYGSYVVELPGRATIFMPDGAQLSFAQASSDSSKTYYTSPRGVFSTLVKTNATGQFDLTSPEGERMTYGKKVVNQSQETMAFLTSQADKWGQALTIEHGMVGSYCVPSRIVDADGNTTSLTYDSGAHLIHARTPDDRVATFKYNLNGEMTDCVDAAGQPFQYSYNGNVFVTQLNTIQGAWLFTPTGTGSGVSGQTNSDYEVNNSTFANFKTDIVDPAGNSRSINYTTDNDTYHNPGRYYSMDFRGNPTDYKTTPLYDGGRFYANAISEIKYPSSLVVGYSYNNDRIMAPTSVVMPGLNIGYTYNALGRPTQASQLSTSNGATRNMNFVYYGDVDLYQIVVSGKTSSSGTSATQTLFQCTNYVNHQPQTVTDQLGHRTDVTYNSIGDPVTVKSYEGSTTHTTTYTYGTSGSTTDRPIGVSYDGVAMVSYGYDVSGRINSATDVQTNLTTTCLYNNLDAVVATFYPDGTKELVDYTCCTLPGMVTDRSGKKTYYDYDLLKRLVRVQDAEGQTMQLNYDANSNRTEFLDANGQRTRWIYNDIARTITKTYADGATEILNADPRGWLASSINGRGQRTDYAHNGFGDLTGIDDPGTVSDVSLSYDAMGRCNSMLDSLGQTNWFFDSADRIIREDGPWANDDVSYSFDDLDRLKTVSVFNSLAQTDINPQRYDTRTFNYDSLSRLSGIAATVNGTSIGTFGLTYQGSSDRLDLLNRPNGTQTQYVYESSALKRPQGVRNKVTSSGANQSSFVASYALSAFKDNFSHNARTYGSEASQTVAYNYTPSSMLKSEITSAGTSGTSSNPLVNLRYQYDSMGNRTQAKNAVRQTQLDSQYNSLNQLTVQKLYSTTSGAPVLNSVTTLSYDGDGNQTQALTARTSGSVTGQANYVYDVASRLVSVEVPNSTLWQFSYDGLGRLRISRYSTWDANNGVWALQEEKRRVYDGRDVVQERNSSNQVTASVTRNGSIGGILARSTLGGATTSTATTNSAGLEARAVPRLRNIDFPSGSAGLKTNTGGRAQSAFLDGSSRRATAREVAVSGSTITTSYYAYDTQGNVTTLTDAAGAVVGSYTYDAWGSTLASSGVRANENPYRYSSKEQLGGLYSFGYRFYNTGTGRWLNRDPLREDGGGNVYGFNYNNPIQFVDSTGACPLIVTGLVGAGLGAGFGAGVTWWRGGSTREIWAAAGRGAVVGGIAGITGNVAAGAVSALAGGGVAAGVAAGAAGGALGDVAGQGAEMALGWRKCYDWKQTVMSGGIGGLMGGGWLCFARGTRVAMGDGSTKAIEGIKVGDSVMSRDEATGKTEAKKVTRLFEHQAEATLVLHFSNGERIETTKEHPFYVEGRGFVPAGEMGIGTSIVTRAGPSVKLTQVEAKNAAATVYNFEVEDTHTYFVGDAGLWVHNACWNPSGKLSGVQNALKHWSKHGSEFPELENVLQYVRKAQGIIDNPSNGTFIKNAGGGTIHFDPSDGTFVASFNGSPLTMHRPVEGFQYFLQRGNGNGGNLSFIMPR